MVFSSLSYLLLFMPLVILLYFIAPRKLRNLLLFIVSLLFYAWGEPIYVVLMIFSTLVDYSHGLLIEKWDDKPALRRAVLISSCVINLGLLCFFKYAGFAVQSVNDLFGLSLTVPKIALPIGISFYTFQTMSYTIDVYRRKCPVQHNIISFGCYVAMFPQLIAGPIVRYVTIAEELDNRVETWDGFFEGTKRFLLGMSKKVLLANGVGALWESVAAQPASELSALTAWLGILAYAFQIFFDFSGYSDMAIGLGRMFGFSFPDNFRYPYISRSVTDFWRRWHITLSTWFREYLYIPLGGNRCSVPRHIFNLAVVWLATGFWHGASWNFVAWGAYFGVLLIAEKYLWGKYIEKAPGIVGWLYTALIVIFGWVLFAFENFSRGFAFMGTMLGSGTGLFDAQAIRLLLDNGLVLLICAVASTPLMANVLGKLQKARPKLHTGVIYAAMIAGFALCMVYVINAGYNPFLYFRF